MKYIVFYVIILFNLITYTCHGYESKDIFQEENIFIFQLDINDELSSDPIELYKYDDKIFIPLSQLISNLDFPITIDLNNKTAQGWFIQKNNDFTLDLQKKSLTINHKNIPIKDDTIFINNQNIYVLKEILESWFKFLIDLNYEKSIINIVTEETLPSKAYLDRAKDWKINSSFKSDSPGHSKDLGLYPYQLFSVPTADIDITQNFNSKTHNHFSTNYSIIAANDLLYFNTSTFMIGMDRNIQDLRFKASKEIKDIFPSDNLKNTQIYLGDIYSPSVSLSSPTGTGRGININNKQIGMSDQFDSTDLIGNATPGWQASLYRNDIMIDFQQIDNSGYYRFLNIPLIYGRNEFKVILYGPRGEILEEIKNIATSENILKKGRYIYNASIDEKNQGLFSGLINKTANSSVIDHKFRKIIQVDYGLTDKLTSNFGVVSTDLAGNQHNYFNTGLKTSLLSNLLLAGDYSYDDNNKNSAKKVTALSKLFDTSITANYILLNNFYSDEFKTQSIDNIKEIDLNKNVKFLHNVNWRLNFKNITYSNKTYDKLITIGNSLGVKGFNFSNNVMVDRTNISRAITGDFNLSKNLAKIFTRMGANYDLKNRNKIKSFYVSGQKNLFNDYFLAVSVNKNLEAGREITYSSNIIKDYNKYRVSLTSEYSRKNIAIGFNLNLSLGLEPVTKKLHVQSHSMATMGSVSTTAFLDSNNNDIMDENEKYLSDFKLSNPSNEFKKYDTEALLVSNYTPYTENNIKIDSSSFNDISLTPKYSNYTISTRPGVTSHINVPVIMVSEVEGKLYSENDKILEDVKIELIDHNGKILETKQTEWDGYYLFDKVTKGNYIIRIPEFKFENKIVKMNQYEVQVDNSGEVYDHDIIIHCDI